MPGKIDVLPSLVKDLSPAHAGIESNNSDVAEMRRGSFEEELLFGKAQYRTLLPTLPLEADTCNRICGDEAFVHSPIEKMAEAFDISVHGCFRDGLCPVALHAVLPDHALRDADDLLVCKMRQEDLEPVTVPFLCAAAFQEPGGEFRKQHVGLELGALRVFEAQFFGVILVDLFGKAAVPGLGRPGVPSPVDPDVTPEDRASFVQGH